MKKLLPVILVMCLLLCSCTSSDGKEDEVDSSEEYQTAENGEFMRNPLNGEKTNEAYSGRVVAVTINNVEPALPHKGVDDADVYFEMYINDYCTRGLALYSDIKSVGDIGSIRSTRYNFTDISQAFDAILFHANGSTEVLNDMKAAGVDNVLADVPIGYRDSVRTAAGYSYEHTLFSTGESLYSASVDKGFRLTNENKDYGMKFDDESSIANGSDANEVEIVFSLDTANKKTTMKYDSSTGTYVYWQYGKQMNDGVTGSPEDFKNVLVISAVTQNVGVYHVAELCGSGDGYYACEGKIVPIKWSRASETSPFTYTLSDGTPLTLCTGSTYVAIVPVGSAVNAR